MTRDVRAIEVQAWPFAAVQVTTKPALWPQQFGPSLDKVWREIRAGRVAKGGHNVMVYRSRPDGLVDIDCGVETSTQFEALGEVMLRHTPAGRAIAATHVGPYAELGASWNALMRWGRAEGHALTDTRWEIYGDWNEDQNLLETELFCLVASK